MLVDEVRITVKAGDGGNGCLAFRREKYVPRGGPSGGDGGNGGDIRMVATIHRNTLLHFRFNPEYTAQRGRHGEGSNCKGHEGESITVQVPVGTTVYDEESGEKLYDFTHDKEEWLAAKGGRGGKGNARFTSSTHQAPTEHEDDPFTTLEPNLGVVQLPDHRSFVVADIPGIIEGAHEGRGLGIQFLRHVERTQVLVHLVDMSATGRDPVHDFETLMTELQSYSPELAEKPMLVLASKMDAAQDPEKVQAVREVAEAGGHPFFELSSVTGQGIDLLKFALAGLVLPSME